MDLLKDFVASSNPLILVGGAVAAVGIVLYFGLCGRCCSSSGSSKRKLIGPPYGVAVKKKDYIVYRSAESPDVLLSSVEGCRTLAQAFKKCVEQNGSRPCLGTRQLVKVEHEEDKKTGKSFEKLTLGKYEWLSYNQVADLADNFGAGLAVLGHRPGKRVAIWCETCAKWQITAQAAFARAFPVVTVYTSLGVDSAVFGFEQSQCETVVLEAKQLASFRDGKFKIPPVVKRIIYIGDLNDDDVKNISGIAFFSWDHVVETGAANSTPIDVHPKPEDMAVIMYTSGSTGVPKGVLISHSNLIAVQASIRACIPSISNQDVYLAYLPLAHVLELAAETTLLGLGVAVGYGTPLTITDNAAKVKRGTKGDCTELRPTIMAAVPAIMDRIRHAVGDKVAHGGAFSQKLFKWAYKRKEAAFKAGRSTPCLDKLVFAKVAKVMGGRIRFMLSGGAPLSPETETFMNVCFCCKVGQGYGLTETCGIATIVREHDRHVGHVGAPLACSEIRLVDWAEGGYLTSDKPPRGEIVVGGPNITMGYLNMPEKTAESFVDEDGQRWFYTGDIGQVNDDGTFRIVDRKKDLVKLSHGEYVALGQVESAVKECPLVENCCVYADSFNSYPIVIVVPHYPKLAKAIGSSDEHSTVCNEPEAKIAMLKAIVAAAQAKKLSKNEIPQKVILSQEHWTPESGLVTAALKLKREAITAHFKDQIKAAYGSK